MLSAKTFKKTIYGILLVSFFLVCLMQSVSSAQTGSVTGTITGPSGPVSGMTVSAYNATTGASVATSPNSDVNGVYTISGLAAGNYKLRASPSGASGLATQWYNGVSDQNLATPVTVTEGVTTSGIDFSLVLGYFIRGTITGASGVTGLTVNAYNATTGGYVRQSLATDATGVYTVYGLAPGVYMLRFNSTAAYAWQYYNNVLDWNLATPVTVAAGNVGNKNFSVVAAGSITGTFAGAAGISGLYAYAQDAITGNGFGTSVVSDVSGNYSITGLPPGDYKIRFNGNANYAQQWYTNAIDGNGATWVTVTAGTPTTGINLSLVAGANITGTISPGVAGVTVSAFDAITGVSMRNSSASDGAGAYTFSGLPPGSYKFRVNTGSTGLATQWYLNAPNQDLATPVTVTAGANPPIDFSLGTGAHNITGTVTRASDGLPVSNLNFTLSDFATGAYVTSGSSGSNGSYTIWGLAPGSYKLRADGRFTGLATKYYDDANGYTPTRIEITTADATGINFSLPAGGSISGTVTNAPPGSTISASYIADNGAMEWSFGTSTQYDGFYIIPGLPAGNYKVGVFPVSGYYASQFYPNARTDSQAQTLQVTAGGAISNVDFTLNAGGKMSGIVRDAGTNDPLRGICFTIFHFETGEHVPYRVCTDTAGQYTTPGLPAGNYMISANGTTNYITTYYNNTFLMNAATPVAVTDNTTNSGKDFYLSSGAGTITGTVIRTSDSQPLGNIRVVVNTALGFFQSANTAFDGSYTLTGLPPGNEYRVGTEPRYQGYAGVYYPNALTQQTATLVTVTAGGTTSAINFSLDNGGSISGVVTNDATPLSGMRVAAQDWTSGSGVAGNTRVQYDGSYKITGLPAGNYKIRAYAHILNSNNAYVAQYYNNTALKDSATSVPVTANETTPSINFNLPPGGKISGVVRSAASSEPIPSLTVLAYDTTTGSLLASVCATRYDGSYVLTGLPAGSYAVRVDTRGSDFASIYYNGVTGISSATPVSVTVGGTAPNINFDLLSSLSLYADFADTGLNQWNGTTWTQLTNSHPASMVASGTSLYIDFAGDGFYKWNGSGFSLLTKDHPASMVASGTSLYAGFAGYGLYQWNGSTWTTLTNSNPASMVASGTSLYAGFAGYGLYQWNGSTWITLTNSNPASMVASGTSLYAGFAGYGLYQWNGSTWITLTNSNPASMVASGTSLYADFAAYGLFEWNGSTWITLTNSHPASMVASDTSLYVDFAGDGLYQWSGSTWTKLTNSHPTGSMVASGTSLYVDFAGDGLYEWNGSTWTKLINNHPARMVAGF